MTTVTTVTTAPPASLVLYEHDDDGVPFAVEVVRASRWEPELAAPPDVAVADVRVVTLASGPAPTSTPPWLAVQVANQHDEAASLPPRQLWAWSPHHRGPSAGLDEFLRAGATALRHPEAAPLDAERQADALRTFARGLEAFAPLVALRAVALERWLHVTFGEPERFADAVLLARVESVAPREAAAMRFLREAVVPADAPEFADLCVDRLVLLEQASPWRFLDGPPMAAALAAVQSWQRRYRRAYAAHFRAAVRERDDALRAADATEARLATLERLNTIGALGRPEGVEAVAATRAARTMLDQLPRDPDAEAATTGGVPLGAANPALAAYRDAAEAAERALLARLRRLSGALAACALAQDDDLRAVRDAIALSEVDHLDRVLDDHLAARIEALIERTPRSPLAVVAQQFPDVTLANLEAAVEEFRRAARQAIDDSPDHRATLGVPESPRPRG